MAVGRDGRRPADHPPAGEVRAHEARAEDDRELGRDQDRDHRRTQANGVAAAVAQRIAEAEEGGIPDQRAERCRRQKRREASSPRTPAGKARWARGASACAGRSAWTPMSVLGASRFILMSVRSADERAGVTHRKGAIGARLRPRACDVSRGHYGSLSRAAPADIIRGAVTMQRAQGCRYEKGTKGVSETQNLPPGADESYRCVSSWWKTRSRWSRRCARL